MRSGGNRVQHLHALEHVVQLLRLGVSSLERLLQLGQAPLALGQLLLHRLRLLLGSLELATHRLRLGRPCQSLLPRPRLRRVAREAPTALTAAAAAAARARQLRASGAQLRSQLVVLRLFTQRDA